VTSANIAPLVSRVNVCCWHEAADHILICEGRFRGEADKQGRVASTAWGEDDPDLT
jgi:hypothetical protein